MSEGELLHERRFSSNSWPIFSCPGRLDWERQNRLDWIFLRRQRENQCCERTTLHVRFRDVIWNIFLSPLQMVLSQHWRQGQQRAEVYSISLASLFTNKLYWAGFECGLRMMLEDSKYEIIKLKIYSNKPSSSSQKLPCSKWKLFLFVIQELLSNVSFYQALDCRQLTSL